METTGQETIDLSGVVLEQKPRPLFEQTDSPNTPETLNNSDETITLPGTETDRDNRNLLTPIVPFGEFNTDDIKTDGDLFTAKLKIAYEEDGSEFNRLLGARFDRKEAQFSDKVTRGYFTDPLDIVLSAKKMKENPDADVDPSHRVWINHYGLDNVLKDSENIYKALKGTTGYYKNIVKADNEGMKRAGIGTEITVGMAKDLNNPVMTGTYFLPFGILRSAGIGVSTTVLRAAGYDALEVGVLTGGDALATGFNRKDYHTATNQEKIYTSDVLKDAGKAAAFGAGIGGGASYTLNTLSNYFAKKGPDRTSDIAERNTQLAKDTKALAETQNGERKQLSERIQQNTYQNIKDLRAQITKEEARLGRVGTDEKIYKNDPEEIKALKQALQENIDFHDNIIRDKKIQELIDEALVNDNETFLKSLKEKIAQENLTTSIQRTQDLRENIIRIGIESESDAEDIIKRSGDLEALFIVQQKQEQKIQEELKKHNIPLPFENELKTQIQAESIRNGLKEAIEINRKYREFKPDAKVASANDIIDSTLKEVNDKNKLKAVDVINELEKQGFIGKDQKKKYLTKIKDNVVKAQKAQKAQKTKTLEGQKAQEGKKINSQGSQENIENIDKELEDLDFELALFEDDPKDAKRIKEKIDKLENEKAALERELRKEKGPEGEEKGSETKTKENLEYLDETEEKELEALGSLDEIEEMLKCL